MKKLVFEIADYTREVERGIRDTKLPQEYFDTIDHIALKAANRHHFDRVMEEFKRGWLAEAEKIYSTTLDGRRIAVGLLAGPLVVGDLGTVDCLEIMEPRPERVGQDRVGLDHAEFIPSISLMDLAARIETVNGIIPEWQPKAKHNTLCIRLGPTQREVKFTDRALRSIISEEYAARETELIYEKPTGRQGYESL